MDPAQQNPLAFLRPDHLAGSVRRQLPWRWQAAFVFTFALLVCAAQTRAAYPPVLVIDGEADPGSAVSGQDAQQYTTSGGLVVVLQGVNGGPVSDGATLNAALNSPADTGTWDGGFNVSLSSHTVLVPQVIVSYTQAPATPPVLDGYDGASITTIGAGTDAAGDYVVTYNGLSDGYIFTFDFSSPFYRYQAGPNPLVINDNSGWSPQSLYLFPSQVYVDGQAFVSTSFTQGINNGYWANQYYGDSNNDSAELSLYVAPDGSSAQMWGNVAGTEVDATWDPNR